MPQSSKPQNISKSYLNILSVYTKRMTLTYEQNKKHIMKWRQENPEKHRKYERDYKRSIYVPILMYKFSSEAKRLMNIRI
jgi:hypothetical protein